MYYRSMDAADSGTHYSAVLSCIAATACICCTACSYTPLLLRSLMMMMMTMMQQREASSSSCVKRDPETKTHRKIQSTLSLELKVVSRKEEKETDRALPFFEILPGFS